MSTMPNTSPAPRFAWSARVIVREMWASVAISVMWLAVLFDAIFGPDFVSTTPGGNSTTIPSAIVVAVFAYLSTRVIAKHGFAPRRDSGD